MTNMEKNRATASAQTGGATGETYVSISKTEWAVLRRVCLRSFRLYVELKWLANFKTGVVGTFKNQQLTYEGLAEMVSLPVRQGVSASHGTVDGKEIKRLLERLEEMGLVADCFHDGTKLTLTLPMSPIRPKAASTATKTRRESPTKNRGVDHFLRDFYEQQAASAGSGNRLQDAGSDGERLPAVAEKLPTNEHHELPGNPHDDWDFDDFADPPSVLVANTNQYLSVPDSVPKTGEALALPSTGGACDTHAPPPPHPERPLLEEGESAETTMDELEIELALRAIPKHVHFMGSAESREFIRAMESMGVKQWEFYKAVEKLMEQGTPLNPSAILRELREERDRHKQRVVRGYGGKVAL